MRLSKNLLPHCLFIKNQIILAETHCSYFISGFQANLFLVCSCDNCQLANRGQQLEDGGSIFLGNSIEFEDNVNHRSSNVRLVDKQIRNLYKNGWFECEIMYCNNKIGKYNISFRNGTSYYLNSKDIDGVELVLL